MEFIIKEIEDKKEKGKIRPEPQNPEYGWRVFSMSKYTKKFKIRLVLEYLSGETGGYGSVAEKYNIPWHTLRGWVEKYKAGGFENLSKKLKNNKYTS